MTVSPCALKEKRFRKCIIRLSNKTIHSYESNASSGIHGLQHFNGLAPKPTPSATFGSFSALFSVQDFCVPKVSTLTFACFPCALLPLNPNHVWLTDEGSWAIIKLSLPTFLIVLLVSNSRWAFIFHKTIEKILYAALAPCLNDLQTIKFIF